MLVSGPLGNTYGDTDNATVRIFEPNIELTKSVSAELFPPAAR